MMAPAPVPCPATPGVLTEGPREITEPGLAPDGLTVDGVDVRGVPCLPFRGKPRE